MTLSDDTLREIEERCEKATPGPWRSMRDGNQYVKTDYMPTAHCVGASTVEGLVRPWNPHRYVSFGFRPQEFETARFLDEDADFIAAARSDLPLLLAEVRRLREELESAPWRASYKAENERAVKAEAERDKLREALRERGHMLGGSMVQNDFHD